MRRWLKVLAAVLALYAMLTAGLWWVMHRPLEQFGQIMARVPTPAMIVLPFAPMWKQARAGTLQTGDLAPDFNLPTTDNASRVKLSAHRGKPVVLVFGSYT